MNIERGLQTGASKPNNLAIDINFFSADAIRGVGFVSRLDHNLAVNKQLQFLDQNSIINPNCIELAVQYASAPLVDQNGVAGS